MILQHAINIPSYQARRASNPTLLTSDRQVCHTPFDSALCSYISKTSSNGCVQFPSGIEVFGTERHMTRMRHAFGEKIQAMRIPKSAIMISDYGSLVRKGMSSGLLTGHGLGIRTSPKIEEGRGNILEIPVDDAVVMQYFTPDAG